ncbi:5'-nucleotidase/UDP-sugar diphosphatase [Breznakia sp. PF5-3]|uniref:bifunctional metallophosphatase/5'-nucleotidase n=1 Tax=unclassified Breznakia TaxID=2623764 RepID=UPI0024069397|nr:MULTISPECIES: 5'-nucleotidase C-terminal domain-containing protein [unclassified Breznakia]MDF9825651.1 5'-nucleotidase/UDP-sugar diphosphatase [Breznakia sp. PM6-1]MDF9836489.1 5'-nucleotidase/UDP-sugar diphosphatase [Breznakia sp. PF5-3]MDF9838666.1 5'-nucleotidase/UDP-sugar diphosphatase [Breznakia sp. PFB2-8]MDF9860709.1 5'-nucleotidase/UDP-sugar diphosphatase [Breznakia sp. PH5-24]
MRNKIKKIVLSLFVIVTAIFAGSINVTADTNEDYDEKVTIVHTNDVHGYVAIEAKVKGYMNTLDVNQQRTLVSAGDMYMGSVFANLNKGEDVVRVMNAMGYEMMTLGNHEFAMDYTQLRKVIQQSNFPVLGGNAQADLLDAIPEVGDYVIKTYNAGNSKQVKVAYLGITTTYKAEGFGPKMVQQANAMRSAAEDEGATIFIAVTHLGVTDSNKELTSYYLAEECPWLTAIIDGHSHSIVNEKYKGVMIAQTGGEGAGFGVMNLYFKDGKLVDIDSETINKDNGLADIQDDPTIAALIAQINEEHKPILSQEIFMNPVFLSGTREVVRASETNLGNIVSDAYLGAAGSDAVIGFAPSVTIRQDLQPGPVSLGDIYNTLGSEQRLLSFEMSGAQIWKAMENCVESWPEKTNAFQQFSGMHVKFDPNNEVGSRIVEITLKDGSVMDLSKTYRVVTREDLLMHFLNDEEQAQTTFKEHGYVYPTFIAYAQANAATFKAEKEGRLEIVDSKKTDPDKKPKPKPRPTGDNDNKKVASLEGKPSTGDTNNIQWLWGLAAISLCVILITKRSSSKQ